MHDRASGLFSLLRVGAFLAGTALLTALPAVAIATDTVYAVNSEADPGEGTCDLAECTLREAIVAANTDFNDSRIEFEIGSGYKTILLATELPPLEQAVVIDGTTQDGYLPLAPAPMIELNGELLGYARGIQLFTTGSTIRALTFNRFGAEAIRIAGHNNHLEGNFVGLDQAGTGIYPSQRSWPAGILVSGTNNTIGGATAAQRNVIAGNTHGISFDYYGSGNVVQGNYIGTDVTGSVALGNLNSGIDINIGTDQVIGGTGSGEGNVVAGAAVDSSTGIYAGTTGNTIYGNLIGVTASGTPFPDKNYGNGVVLSGSGNQLGGTAPGAGNVISGWTERGVGASGSGHQIVGNLIGTDANGTIADGNGYAGIILQSSNSLIEGNVISANGGQPGWGYGLFISDPDNSGNVIRANKIGTAVDGVSPLGNENQGILLSNQTHGNVVGGTNPGDGNVIAFNALQGVHVSPHGGECCSYGNLILGNSIHDNGTEEQPALGISLAFGDPNDAYDLDTGANGLQNYPNVGAVTSNGLATTIDGTLSSTPSRSFRIELFRSDSCDPSGFGEGQVYLGSVDVTSDANGNASFSKEVAEPIDESNGFVTATATDQTANETSAFSHCNVWPRTTSEENVAPGDTVSSAPSTSTTDPVVTSVQLSATAGGDVTIVDGPTTVSPPSSYTFLGSQVAVDAPAGDSFNPLTLTFELDPSVTYGISAGEIHVFRTGDGSSTPIEVLDCIATGPIDPDPCISARSYTETNSILISVLTSHASTWNFGQFVPPQVPPTVDCAGRIDKAAGSGTFTPSKHKFAISAQSRNCVVSGTVTFDSAKGVTALKFSSTSTTTYAYSLALNKVTVTGVGKLNGSAGWTFEASAYDNGPKKSGLDSFEITFTNGSTTYTFSGNLTADGSNITFTQK